MKQNSSINLKKKERINFKNEFVEIAYHKYNNYFQYYYYSIRRNITIHKPIQINICCCHRTIPIKPIE